MSRSFPDIQRKGGFLIAHVGHGKAWEGEPAWVSGWSSQSRFYCLCDRLFFVQLSYISLSSFAIMTFLDEGGTWKGRGWTAYLPSVGQDQARKEMIQAVGGESPFLVSAKESSQSLITHAFPSGPAGVACSCHDARPETGLSLGWQSPAGLGPACLGVCQERERLIKGCHLYPPPHELVTFIRYS